MPKNFYHRKQAEAPDHESEIPGRHRLGDGGDSIQWFTILTTFEKHD